MEKEIIKNFADKLRLRVCGILKTEQGVLMIRHRGLSRAGYFWSPPGGGLSFGQSVTDCLKQEFLEETGLRITVENFLFVNEFFNHPLHAVELFFRVKQTGGDLCKGFDPEMSPEGQIIEAVKYFNADDLREHNGPQLHAVFRNLSAPEQVLNLKGYFHNWK